MSSVLFKKKYFHWKSSFLSQYYLQNRFYLIFNDFLKLSLGIKQGLYTTGPSKFQDFSRTFKDHIYKNPGPAIARKTETIQTNQQTM